MLWSKSFIPTLKEVPSDAKEKSHILMLRAGLIRQLSSGVYSFLPSGWKAMQRAMAIIREEMNAIGAQEILMPSTTPMELWHETGRDIDMGEIMYKFEDRRGTKMALAPTHEEIITDIVRSEIHSYKELPQVWYQFQTKFRDEPRPRSGLLRVREFIMKDSYTMCSDDAQLEKAYRAHETAYRRIFDRCGLAYHVVGAASGLMGGTGSEEFMVPSESGEDIVATCECGFAQNLEIAESVPAKVKWIEVEKDKVETPNRRTIDEVSAFLKMPAGQMLKSLLYIGQSGRVVMACLRGDHELSEEKLQAAFGEAIRPMEAEKVLKSIGAPVGFIGPIDIPENIEVLVDNAVDPQMPFATGANEVDFHFVGYKIADIPNFKKADLRRVADGDLCIRCGKKLELVRTIEIGHIFKLGTKYSLPMGATFLDENGELKPVLMGSYGIGVGRILAAAIDLYADKDGISWPITIAPFEAVVTAVNIADEEVFGTAKAIYEELCGEKGIDVLFDDRDVRAGVKFKDADLIGAPIRVTVGRGVKNGVVEIVNRREKTRVELPIESAVEAVIELREKLYEELS